MKSTKLIWVVIGVIIWLALSGCASGNEKFEAYEVSNIVYGFSTDNSYALNIIAFELNKPASEVSVNLYGEHYSCSSEAPSAHWTCPLGGVAFSGGSMRVLVTP